MRMAMIATLIIAGCESSIDDGHSYRHAIESKPAPGPNETEVTGTILCTKCALGQTRNCQTAIQSKLPSGPSRTYYLKDAGESESWHQKVHGGARLQGTVRGVVSQRKPSTPGPSSRPYIGTPTWQIIPGNVTFQ